jgi:hypothetical protein
LIVDCHAWLERLSNGWTRSPYDGDTINAWQQDIEDDSISPKMLRYRRLPQTVYSFERQKAGLFVFISTIASMMVRLGQDAPPIRDG